MIRNLRHVTRIGALAIAVASSMRTSSAQSVTPPPVPADIQAPAGNVPFLKGQATGAQNYICLPSATGYSWTLFGPQATLFLKFKVFNLEIQQQIVTHYLSPNPDESGTLRATWQSSLDTSAVWALATKIATDPNFVAPGAIPWLLLKVVGSERGPGDGAMLTPTTYIQRVNTSGGPAPATGCSQASEVGAKMFVPYTAEYFFFKAAH